MLWTEMQWGGVTEPGLFNYPQRVPLIITWGFLLTNHKRPLSSSNFFKNRDNNGHTTFLTELV